MTIKFLIFFCYATLIIYLFETYIFFPITKVIFLYKHFKLFLIYLRIKQVDTLNIIVVRNNYRTPEDLEFVCED